MSAVVADTHAILWYLFDPSRLLPAAVTALDDATAAGDPIYTAARFSATRSPGYDFVGDDYY